MRKTIFEYDNYRKYLTDYYQDLKLTDPKFSFRHFAKLAGLKTPNLLKRVMEGQRNLTLETIKKFSKGLNHTNDEAFFFKNLVMLNQTSSIEERQIYARHLLKTRGFRKVHPLAEAQYHYFTQWYFVALRELIGTPAFDQNPEWISKRFGSEISVAEASSAIVELIKLGLIYANEEGKVLRNHIALSTPDEVTSSFATTYHYQMILKGREAIDRIPREEREISGSTFVLSKKNLKEIKEIIQRFRKEVVQIADQEQDGDSVYQLNLQLFPLVRFSKENKK